MFCTSDAFHIRIRKDCSEQVCVCTICIDGIFFIAGGCWGTLQSAANEDAAMLLCKRTCIIYTYIVPPLGAYKTQLGGTCNLSLLFFYGQCLLWLRLYVISYYINFHSSCQFSVGVFARPLRSTSEFAKIVLSNCVKHLNRCKTSS